MKDNKRDRGPDDGLIPKHGGYRRLKTFQLAELIYDVTILFCDTYIDPQSRTRDQMVQAARSGRQNIAEGSMDSATSKKMEMKLTGVARGSLEELRLDYEDYLRHRDLPQWTPDHPALQRFKARRCATLKGFREWVRDEIKLDAEKETKPKAQRENVSESLWVSVYAANGALSLLNLCIRLLNRQLQAQADAFEQEGGFTERLYRKRSRRLKDGY